jgi:hypothetical protein
MSSVFVVASIVLENACKQDGAPRTTEFDGQIYISEGKTLAGVFRYYHTDGSPTFDPDVVGYYVACIQVSFSDVCFAILEIKYLPVFY